MNVSAAHAARVLATPKAFASRGRSVLACITKPFCFREGGERRVPLVRSNKNDNAVTFVRPRAAVSP
jgi:hypothetical protein